MTTSANGTDAPSAPPRRTIFDWSDLITIRIPVEKLEILAATADARTRIAFPDAEVETARGQAADVNAEIVRQAYEQLAAKHGQREYPQGWLIETIRERFDDPATIALLEVIACAVRGEAPTMAIDPYWRSQQEESRIDPEGSNDLTTALIEVYEEWLAARPERMVPPETAKPDRAEAMRLRRAGHEYWEEGEKGKAADCFDQALARLLGPDPDALGAVVMDHAGARDAQAEFLAAWDRIAPLNRFLSCTRSPEFRRALLRGDRSSLTKGEVECLEAVRLSEDFDLHRLLDWRDSTHATMEKLRVALRRTREIGLDVSPGQDERFRELVRLVDSLTTDLAEIGLEARR